MSNHYEDVELRPVKREDGSGLWDALDGAGCGHTLGLDTPEEVRIWVDGYEVGARENM